MQINIDILEFDFIFCGGFLDGEGYLRCMVYFYRDCLLPYIVFVLL